MNESILNHNEIFALLYNGNINGAICAFSEKTRELEFSPFIRTAYLTSLNMGIYNYILMKENVSLHCCCMANERKISNCTNASILKTGTEVIVSYGLDTNYLCEKYRNVHIKHAASYIHEHLSETLTLDQVSREININSTYLCQLFKQETGVSFSSYILNQRLKLADRLLKETTYSIQEIAVKCGFHSTSYFSTCYKKFSKRRPSQIRMVEGGG